MKYRIYNFGIDFTSLTTFFSPLGELQLLSITTSQLSGVDYDKNINMKKLIKKDLLKRKLVNKLEYEKMLLKAIHSNLEIPLKFRIGVFYQSSLLPRNASRVRIRNRSLINGRSRGIITHTGLDRMSLRGSILKGDIPGYTPWSW